MVLLQRQSCDMRERAGALPSAPFLMALIFRGFLVPAEGLEPPTP